MKNPHERNVTTTPRHATGHPLEEIGRPTPRAAMRVAATGPRYLPSAQTPPNPPKHINLLTPHCIRHIAFATLHSPHCIRHIAFATLHSPHCIRHIAFATLHSPHCIRLYRSRRTPLHGPSHGRAVPPQCEHGLAATPGPARQLAAPPSSRTKHGMETQLPLNHSR